MTLICYLDSRKCWNCLSTSKYDEVCNSDKV